MKGCLMVRLRLSRLASRVRGQHCGWAIHRRQQSSVASTGLGTSGVAALDRGFIRLDGPDALPFLQGLTTNDTTLLENGQTQCQYTSLLHPKGRVLWEMFVWSRQGTVLLDCDRTASAAIEKRLRTFLLRANVEISDATAEWAAYSLQSWAATGLPAEATAVLDPRCNALGYRVIAPAGSLEASADSGDYTALRRRLGIAEGIAEITPDKFFPSELNLERLGAVSFTKGCYVGQELTARTHFTGQVRKRVLPCFISDSIPVEEDTDAEEESSEARRQLHIMDGKGKLVPGRKGQAGVLLTEGKGCSNGGVALASLRLEHAISPESTMTIRTADERHVLPYLPSWWAAAEHASSIEKETAAAEQKIMAAEAAALRANRAIEEMEARHAQALAQLPTASIVEDDGGSEQYENGEHEDVGPAPCDDARYVALFEYETEELAQLEVLNLARCDPALTDWDVEDSLEILEQAKLLAEVDLSNNQLTDECLQPLCMMIARGGAPALMCVDLRGNPNLTADLVVEMGSGLAMARPNFRFILDDAEGTDDR